MEARRAGERDFRSLLRIGFPLSAWTSSGMFWSGQCFWIVSS
ncbi:hypothetical protein [Fibrobacter sp. HC4]|nr:hypothetical protein [Fibrobacter succinogenes]